MMKCSNAGIRLIKNFEGCKLRAYRDIVGAWTIGYGHTGADVAPGQAITQVEADQLLAADLRGFEQCVLDAVEVELTQNQFDALVSFAYNLGCRALAGSTLLKLLNAGNTEAAAQQFARWNKAGGKYVAGLARRRRAEREMFNA